MLVCRAAASYDSFDPSLFRKAADQALQKKWMALDYYFTEDHLFFVLLEPNDCHVWSASPPYRFHRALEACQQAGRTHELPLQSDLNVLGKWLLPSFLYERLTPDTILLLAPHKGLHTVPWNALQPEFVAKPLAQVCIPAVTPSLHSLQMIWQRRASSVVSKRQNGLLIGLSSFGGKRRDLPEVGREISSLSSRLSQDGRCLAEEHATWNNLLAVKEEKANGQENGLARFAWLHIATHFFADPRNGRFNGLALGDGDVWLDKLYDLSPLPSLVTLSACNSISSFVYEGDEHADIPTTCLAAGADSVVGSLWLIKDEAAAEFASSFYEQYLAGQSPAEALVRFQRELLQRGSELGQWASFVCIGAP